MNKTYLLTTIVALAFLTSAAGMSVGAETEEPIEEPRISLGEMAADHEGEYEESQCDDQLALYLADVPGCGDIGGEHVRGGYMIIGFQTVDAGNVGPIPLTGTVQALLTHDGGEVDFRCSWDAGTFMGCSVESVSWPNLGATFTFTCQSLEGSIGNWGECYIGHA